LYNNYENISAIKFLQSFESFKKEPNLAIPKQLEFAEEAKKLNNLILPKPRKILVKKY
jgi:hypothetical protein